VNRMLLTLSLVFTTIVAAAGAAYSATEDQASETSMLTGQARASVAAFASALKSELTAAMQSGGPLQAIEVCHGKAPVIAREVSQQQGVEVSRVSARNRNPANAPNAWQAEVLDSFASLLADGSDPGTLEWQQIVRTDDGREFRYMKAIPTAALCLTCHGATLAHPVAAKIAELYPEDQATGYSEGDLRGAFVVTKTLKQDRL